MLTKETHVVYYYALMLILIAPVFIDFFNGVVYYQLNADFSLGVLFRSVTAMITAYFMFFIKEKTYQIYLFTIILLFISFNPVWAGLGLDYKPHAEIIRYVRILLPHFLLCFFLYVNSKYKLDIVQLMRWQAIFAFLGSLAIIFSFFTGIGTETYDDRESYGMSSFFIAHNDMGLAMLLSFPMCFYVFLREVNLKWFVMTFSIFAALMMMATRTALMGATGVLLLYLGCMLVYNVREVKIKVQWRVLMLFFTVVIVGIGAYAYALYILQYPYLIRKFVLLFEEGPRSILMEAATHRLSQRALPLSLFGEGAISFSQSIADFFLPDMSGKDAVKAVEQDLMDMWGVYGWILGSLILLWPLALCFKQAWTFLINNSLMNLTFLVVIVLFTFHSYTAGHALGSTIVSTSILLPYFYILKRKDFMNA